MERVRQYRESWFDNVLYRYIESNMWRVSKYREECVCVCVYVCIYIYIKRERDLESNLWRVSKYREECV